MAKIIISLLLIASLAGIITDISTTAVPGDPLYSFKLNVTEQAGRLLAFSDMAKAEFSAQIATDRLTEIETMKQKGTLTITIETNLLGSFDEQTADVMAQVQTIEAKGHYKDALRVVQQFQTTIANIIAALPTDSVITSHLQATLSSLSTLSGSISTSTQK